MSPAAGPLPPEEFARLLEAAAAGSPPLSPAAVSALSVYLSELDRWRRKVNLTGDLSAEELVQHVLESAAGDPLIPHRARVIDIGSGAGLPGIPLAILRPDLYVTLLEPRAKRVAFMRHVRRTLALENATCLRERVESVSRGERRSFWTVVTIRAVGSLVDIIGKAPFLVPGGRLLVWTTEHVASAKSLGPLFTLRRVERLRNSERRVIALFEKGS